MCEPNPKSWIEPLTFMPVKITFSLQPTISADKKHLEIGKKFWIFDFWFFFEAQTA